MSIPMLTRKIQYLAKIQTVEGTAETLAAADGKTRVNIGASFEPQAPPTKRDIASDSLSPFGLLAGEKGGAITVVSEINCPDVMTNLPEQEPTLRSCGMTVTPTRRIPIGAIATGPMLRNSTLTGGTSAATGRLLVDSANGVTHLYYSPISGAFTSGEVITASGGGTATSSAVSAVWGARANPISTFVDVITAEFQNDGFAWSIRDAMSTMGFDIEASKQGMFKFTPMGAKASWGTKAMTASVPYDVGEPPILQNSGLTIASFVPVFNKVSFDLGNKVVYRRDANTAGNTGIKGARINDRDPRLKIFCEHELTSVFDFYGAYEAQTKHAIKFQIGNTIGKRFAMFAAAAQFAAAPAPAEIDGIRGIECEFLLTRSAQIQGADGEFEFLWY